MKKRILIFLFVTICLSLPFSARAQNNVWEETGENPAIVRQGIPAYGETKGVYQRNGQPVVSVELQAPVLVAAATESLPWGFFQFPGIFRSTTGGLLVATWQMKADSPGAYGEEGSGFRLSSDNGKTWYSSGQSQPARNGTLIIPFTGERISIYTPAALNRKDLQLPQPIASNMNSYGETYTYYRLHELPGALQGVYINQFNRSNAYTGRIQAGLDDPGAVRYATNDLLPVVWWGDMKALPDNSIVAGIYPMFYERETGGVDPSGVSFYRSVNNGAHWTILGKIPYRPDLTVDPNGSRRQALGFTEPAFEVLPDGTFLCVMRSADGYGNGPMYISRSSDQGASWLPAKPFAPSGVLPKLLQLENGVLVLASGRPGVQIRFSVDGKGEQWTDPFEMMPYNNADDQVSCGYTQLLATGFDSFLIIYSDFQYLDPGPEELRKSIKVREVKLTNFIPTNYTVTFDANDGSGEPEPQTKTHGTALTLSETVPVRTGYTFRGWETTKENLALGKTADASSAYSTQPVGNITDGAVTTRWASGTSNDAQWVQVDLRRTQAISQVRILWPGDAMINIGYNRAETYRIEISNDGTNFTPAVSTVSSAEPTAIGMIGSNAGWWIDTDLPAGTNARYVRMQTVSRKHATNLLSMFEFEVRDLTIYQPGDSFTTDANTTLYALWEEGPPSHIAGSASDGTSHIEAWSADGRLFFKVSHPASVKIYTPAGTRAAQLNVEKEASVALPQGVYIVKSVSKSATETIKIVNSK